MKRGWLAAAVLGLVAFRIWGCVSLTPLRDVQRRLPAERFIAVGSQRVHVEQAGAGPPVVLLHGFGGSAYTWRRVVPGLAAQHRVVAVDLNGFGWTERPSDHEAYGASGQLALVVGVLDALGLERPAVVGHSWGGGLGLRLASAHPQRISSLVVVAGSVPTGEARRRSGTLRRWMSGVGLRTVLLREGMIRRGLRRSVRDPKVVTDDLVAGYLSRLRVEGADRAFAGLNRAAAGPVVALDRLDLPVLLVWGDEDRVVPPRVGEGLEHAIPGARRVVLDRCGHLPMEEDPEGFLALVLPFLAAHSERGSPADAMPVAGRYPSAPWGGKETVSSRGWEP